MDTIDLTGKTINGTEFSVYGIKLYFTDGSRFVFDATNGRHSTCTFYEKEDE